MLHKTLRAYTDSGSKMIKKKNATVPIFSLKHVITLLRYPLMLSHAIHIGESQLLESSTPFTS